ncbi:MAG: hypothetical protein ACK5LX_06345 [Oscillospiraceae bacterium]
MDVIKIGLLPLYVKTYDDSLPQLRERLEAFYAKVAAKLEDRGYRVVTHGFCRLEGEFQAAVDAFAAEGAQCIVTLHMAYSPSLESVAALSGTKLPLVVLDTTETFDFGFEQSPEEILYNHGIHGVMDMCSLLLRRGKPYIVCAGHWEDERLFQKLDRAVSAAVAANAWSGMRVGRLGEPFAGMGDFLVEDGKLQSDLGVQVVQNDGAFQEYFHISGEEADEEVAVWKAAYTLQGVEDDTLRTAAVNCLGLRRWMEAERLDALTVNFLATSGSRYPTMMPFIELCRAMERGKGYAGEGDTLTAALVASLMRMEPATSFVEIFCPDWKGNRLFLSHMGEMNTALAADRPLLTKVAFPYTDAHDPAVIKAAYRPGKAVYVNLTPSPTGYRLFLTEVEMVYGGSDAFVGDIRGWMQPGCDIARFLEAHSCVGASHHSAVVYGDYREELELFGKLMGFEVVTL